MKIKISKIVILALVLITACALSLTACSRDTLLRDTLREAVRDGLDDELSGIGDIGDYLSEYYDMIEDALGLLDILEPDKVDNPFPFREARTEDERIALQFVHALWEEDYATIFELTDLYSLYPATPNRGGDDVLLDLIISRCITNIHYPAQSNDFNPTSFHGSAGTLWNRAKPLNITTSPSSFNEKFKPLGIMDVGNTDGIILAAHGLWGEQNDDGENLFNVVTIFKLNIVNGKITSWIDDDIDHWYTTVRDIQYEVPANATVIFRGEVLTPTTPRSSIGVAERNLELWDIYTLPNVSGNLHEEVSIDFGGRLGIITDWVQSSSRGNAIGNSGNYAAFTNLRGLIITGERYIPIWEEVREASERIMLTIFAALQAHDISMFRALWCDYERDIEYYRRYNFGDLSFNFNRWVEADRRDSWADFTFEAVTYGTRARTRDTLQTFNTVTLTTGSGVQYTGDIPLHLRYIDGEWKLAVVSPVTLMSRSASDWNRVTD